MLLAINTTVRLLLLRGLMIDPPIVGETPLAAYIVPLNDAHQGTRVPSCSARLSYISGFTGSSGVAVVTQSKALLWTDGRYFTQAGDELDNNWELMREGLHETPTIEKYLASELSAGANIGVDPALFSITAWNSMQANLHNADQNLVPIHTNLIDLVWEKNDEKPPCPNEPVQHIPVDYTGKSTEEKLTELRKLMTDKSVVGVVLVQLDDIAWLLNLRGFDIPSAALFLSFVIVKQDGFELFVDEAKISQEIRNLINQDRGAIYAYERINERLNNLVETTTGKILLDKTSSFSLVDVVTPAERRLLELSPIIPMKAVKNPVEIEGIKRALIRDAAHLARFYAWLEGAVLSGQIVTELSASDKLMSFRKESDDVFLTTSFTTIAGVDSNGAIIHYRATNETNKRITPFSMFLVDAGATYKDGTTDITRTFHFGVPSDHQRECYTRVLKGQIAVARAIFPIFSRGNRLDSFARKFLWDVGLDYLHGTGHGIGINVHEGPSRISYDYNLAPDDQGLRENMLTSNEPGYYEEGSFGIRLENIVRVVNSTIAPKNGRQFLAIEDLTFLPYQHKLIKKSLLNKAEIEYLNEYQEKCRNIVGQYVKENFPGDPAYEWIIKETEPL